MRLAFKIAAFVAYVAFAIYLETRANRGLKDKRRTHWVTPLLSPDIYKPEALPARRLANCVSFGGLVALLIALLAF